MILYFYNIHTALSLPGVVVLLSLAADAIFGSGIGAIYVNNGATVGASLAFRAGYLFRDGTQ